MKNHPIYRQLRQHVLDNNYTIEQVQNATQQQVATLLGCDKRDLPRLQNMQRCIIRELVDIADESKMQELKQQALSWLQANFPNFACERGRDGPKPYVTIWLKGKPEEPNG